MSQAPPAPLVPDGDEFTMPAVFYPIFLASVAVLTLGVGLCTGMLQQGRRSLPVGAGVERTREGGRQMQAGSEQCHVRDGNLERTAQRPNSVPPVVLEVADKAYESVVQQGSPKNKSGVPAEKLTRFLLSSGHSPSKVHAIMTACEHTQQGIITRDALRRGWHSHDFPDVQPSVSPGMALGLALGQALGPIRTPREPAGASAKYQVDPGPAAEPLPGLAMVASRLSAKGQDASLRAAAVQNQKQ